MPWAAIDDHLLAAIGDIVLKGSVLIELGSYLNEKGRLQVGTVTNPAAVRLQLSQKDF